MGKGRQPQQVIQNTGLPDYVDPYYKRLLKGAEEASMPFDPETGESTYTPYGQERLTSGADYNDITDARKMIRGIAGSGIPGMTEAVGTQNEAISGIRGLATNVPGFSASSFTAANVSPYAGFQAGSADPYSGFQAGQADPFSDFTRSSVDAYGGFQAGQADPFSDFQQADFSKAQGTEFQFGPARQFTGQEVADYMDPYMQNVVDLQKREAIKDFDRQQAGRDASAVQAGAFGGSRQAVVQGMAEQNLQDRLSDIQQVGSQAAFDRAMQMFESDRAAQMDVEGRRADEAARVQGIDVGETGRTQAGTAAEMARTQAGRAAELARTQGIGLDEAARIQAAEAAELARTQGVDVSEAARTQAARAAELARTQGISIEEAARIQNAEAAELARTQGIGLDEAARIQAAEAAELARTQGIDVAEQGRVQAGDAAEQARIQAAREAQRYGTAGLYGDLAGAGRGLLGLGELSRATGIQDAQLLETLGGSIRAEDQAKLDLAYQDFLRQQDYPMSQYERFAGILTGTPTGNLDVSRTTYGAFNPIQAALGTGLSALGLYRGLGGGYGGFGGGMR